MTITENRTATTGDDARGEGDLIEALAPPFGPAAQAVVETALAGAG
jgi:hypothetical protein